MSTCTLHLSQTPDDCQNLCRRSTLVASFCVSCRKTPSQSLRGPRCTAPTRCREAARPAEDTAGPGSPGRGAGRWLPPPVSHHIHATGWQLQDTFYWGLNKQCRLPVILVSRFPVIQVMLRLKALQSQVWLSNTTLPLYGFLTQSFIAPCDSPTQPW